LIDRSQGLSLLPTIFPVLDFDESPGELRGWKRMEYDFDKEIDTLLRKAHGDAPLLVGDYASAGHLDADAISAFAENAMPENSRATYSAHLAECHRCRKILSNLLVMSAETAPVAAPALGAMTIAERAPWYKRLFLFPNLAYVMGGLVLIFSGFLGYTVLQRSGGDVIVSQSSEPEVIRGGPNAQVEQELSTQSATNAAANIAAANTAANSNSSTAAARAPEPGASGPRAAENSFVLDGADSASAKTDAVHVQPPSATTGAGLPAAAPPKDARERGDFAAKEKVEDKLVVGAPQELAKNNSLLKQAPGASSQSGPMRNNDNQYNRQLENMELREKAAAKRSAARDEESSSGRKVVGGKTFERKQGVWYDTTYQSRPTVNVRRGTNEFNRLDSGLRSIANSLGGTAVIVWGAKAYRIQ
jgi:hypothetical protein